MCRNIKTLYNIEPPVTEVEVYASALQFVRKVSGYRQPSKANQEAFEQAVKGVATVTQQLLDNLETSATPRNRENMAAKARERNEKRSNRNIIHH
jgi:hypothetical protein